MIGATKLLQRLCADTNSLASHLDDRISQYLTDRFYGGPISVNLLNFVTHVPEVVERDLIARAKAAGWRVSVDKGDSQKEAPK